MCFCDASVVHWKCNRAHWTLIKEKKKNHMRKKTFEQKLHSVEKKMKFIAKIFMAPKKRWNANRRAFISIKRCLTKNKKRSSSFDSKLFMLLLNRWFFPHTDWFLKFGLWWYLSWFFFLCKIKSHVRIFWDHSLNISTTHYKKMLLLFATIIILWQMSVSCCYFLLALQ